VDPEDFGSSAVLDAYRNRYLEQLSRVFGNEFGDMEDIFKKFKYRTDPLVDVVEDFPFDDVLNMHSTIASELGSNKRYGMRLHFHISLTVTHTGRLQVKYDSLAPMVNRSFEEEGLPLRINHVWIKACKPAAEDYAEKEGFSKVSEPIILD
jgi:hypothetical protein